MILAPFLFALSWQQPPPTPLLPVRPRDPFVFRCVLDKNPRMVTVALDDDMWLAYDATSCALYKAWKGGVKFDGPVYTTVHGPQPTTIGADYSTAPTGDAWTAFQDGKPLACRARFGGYRVAANSVSLEWRIQIANGPEIVVDERPEFVRPKQLFNAEQLDDLVLGDGAQPGLQRVFEAHDLPTGMQVNVTMRTDSLAGKFGAFERERIEDVQDAKGTVTATHVFSQLPLTHDQPKNGAVLVFQPVQVQPPATEAKPADKK